MLYDLEGLVEGLSCKKQEKTEAERQEDAAFDLVMTVAVMHCTDALMQ